MTDVPQRKRRYNRSLVEKIDRLCQEKYEEVQLVNEAYYDSCLTMSESAMKTIIKLILNATYPIINKHVLAAEWNDRDMFDHFLPYLELLFDGRIGFSKSDGSLLFVKPLGEPPSDQMWERWQDRIGAAAPLVDEVIRECLKRQDGAAKKRAKRTATKRRRDQEPPRQLSLWQ